MEVKSAASATGAQPAPESVPVGDEKKFAATPAATREAFVRRTGSGYTPVRHVLVQRYDGDERSSTIAKFLSTRKRRALVLYLLLLTGWDPERKPHRSEVWLRALQVDGGKVTWSASSVSQAWSDLVAMGLVSRQRESRLAKVTPRREDASADYSKPDGKKKVNRYFALPGEFWTDGWFDELSLPALCILLILLKETNDDQSEIHLTYEQTAKWYGLSVSSAKKGYTELEAAGLVSVRREVVTEPFAPDGYTVHLHYSLNGAFSTAERAKARAAAQKAAQARTGNGAPDAKSITGKKKPKRASNKRPAGAKQGHDHADTRGIKPAEQRKGETCSRFDPALRAGKQFGPPSTDGARRCDS